VSGSGAERFRDEIRREGVEGVGLALAARVVGMDWDLVCPFLPFCSTWVDTRAPRSCAIWSASAPPTDFNNARFTVHAKVRIGENENKDCNTTRTAFFLCSMKKHKSLLSGQVPLDTKLASHETQRFGIKNLPRKGTFRHFHRLEPSEEVEQEI
jgi:hypothetical protein